MPKASIIIRTFNEEKHIGNLLRKIAEQDYQNYETIVVDSGSKDKTLEVAKQFNVRIIQIESRDFTFGYSLNVGCEASVGEYLIFVSAHVLPTDTRWLSNLLAPFANEKVAMVYGRQQGHVHSKFSEQRDFARLFGVSTFNSNVPLHYANNANSAIRKNLWEKYHFDEYLFGLEDIDWARHFAKEEFTIHYEPTASIYHIHEERWYQVLNRYRREAIAAVRIGLDTPPQASTSIVRMLFLLLTDLIYTFPNYGRLRLSEIVRFRYFQWKGSVLGWRQGKNIDFEIEKNSIFYPSDNYSLVIEAPHKASIQETQPPLMRPGDILIKVDYVGVCRTDLEVFEGTLGYYRDGVATYPIVPGHEFSGTVARVGSSNSLQERFKIGDRVVGECILSRGKGGRREEVGVINVNGAYSKYVVVPGIAVHKIPDHLNSKTAVLTEPLAVVLRSLRRIDNRIKEGAAVAVVGAGQIGNLATQVLTKRGLRVDVFDQDRARLRLLEKIAQRGSTSLNNFETYDVVIEATGSRQVLEYVLGHTNVDVTLLLLGFPYGDTHYNFEDIVGKEKMIVGSVGADHVDFIAALELLSSLDTGAFTETVFPLDEYEEAWKSHRTSRQLKIMLQP